MPAHSAWPTRMSQWMSSARIRRVAGEARPRIKTIPKNAVRGRSESDNRATCSEDRSVLLMAGRTSTFLYTSSRLVERSQPWSGLDAMLRELIA
jgi:hypothetical protein